MVLKHTFSNCGTCAVRPKDHLGRESYLLPHQGVGKGGGAIFQIYRITGMVKNQLYVGQFFGLVQQHHIQAGTRNGIDILVLSATVLAQERFARSVVDHPPVHRDT